MSTVKSANHRAKIEGQQDDIFYGSSLALQGVFVEVIRSRFKGINETNGIPYYWKSDPTPDSEETNQISNPRLLKIDSAYLEFPDARNFRPAILIDAKSTVPLKDAVTNKAGEHRYTGIELFWCRCRTEMEVLVVDETRGACSVLADIVWFHLLATRMLVRAEFNIHEITEPIKSQVIPARKDKDIWECSISFNVEVEMRWYTRPIAPLLNEIKMNLRTIGNGDPNKGAISIAIYGGNGPKEP